MNKQYSHKSFYLTPYDQEALEFLSKEFGLNISAVMRKLINEAHAIRKYEINKRGELK